MQHLEPVGCNLERPDDDAVALASAAGGPYLEGELQGLKDNVTFLGIAQEGQFICDIIIFVFSPPQLKVRFVNHIK